ncbi:hypothetical protein B0H11DRAFT_543194 [Mycena galericulata]|nr:hypothetical protein B0H11DRAFT_543194 [Mycena galericulata]
MKKSLARLNSSRHSQKTRLPDPRNYTWFFSPNGGIPLSFLLRTLTVWLIHSMPLSCGTILVRFADRFVPTHPQVHNNPPSPLSAATRLSWTTGQPTLNRVLASARISWTPSLDNIHEPPARAVHHNPVRRAYNHARSQAFRLHAHGSQAAIVSRTWPRQYCPLNLRNRAVPPFASRSFDVFCGTLNFGATQDLPIWTSCPPSGRTFRRWIQRAGSPLPQFEGHLRWCFLGRWEERGASPRSWPSCVASTWARCGGGVVWIQEQGFLGRRGARGRGERME